MWTLFSFELNVCNQKLEVRFGPTEQKEGERRRKGKEKKKYKNSVAFARN